MVLLLDLLTSRGWYLLCQGVLSLYLLTSRGWYLLCQGFLLLDLQYWPPVVDICCVRGVCCCIYWPPVVDICCVRGFCCCIDWPPVVDICCVRGFCCWIYSTDLPWLYLLCQGVMLLDLQYWPPVVDICCVTVYCYCSFWPPEVDICFVVVFCCCITDFLRLIPAVLWCSGILTSQVWCLDIQYVTVWCFAVVSSDQPGLITVVSWCSVVVSPDLSRLMFGYLSRDVMLYWPLEVDICHVVVFCCCRRCWRCSAPITWHSPLLSEVQPERQSHVKNYPGDVHCVPAPNPKFLNSVMHFSWHLDQFI